MPLIRQLRRLLRHPRFSLSVVVTLGLGVGATGLVFGVVDTVLVQPLPFRASGRLVRVFHRAPQLGLVEDLGLSDATYFRLRESGVLEDLALYAEDAVNLSGEGPPLRVQAARVSHSFFNTLGIPPLLGRPFLPEEERADSTPVVILAEGLWRARFGARSDLVDETFLVDGVAHQVVGVMPDKPRFPTPDTELWLPYRVDPARTNLGRLGIPSVGRLAEGVTLEGAERALDGRLTPLEEIFPVEQGSRMLAEAGFTTRVVPLRDQVVGDVGPTLGILLGSVGFLFLVACANVGNLFLARAERRETEIAVRMALGADWRRLLRTFLFEGAALGTAAAGTGLLLAYLGTRALLRFGPRNLPRISELGLDLRSVAVIFGLGIGSGLLLGLLPALRYRLARAGAALRETTGFDTRGGRRVGRSRDLLMAAQMAFALVLLVGAGLAYRSYRALADLDPGFNPEGVLTFQLSLPEADYPGEEAPAGFAQRALEELAGLPGVESVGTATGLPLGIGSLDAAGVSIEDHPDQPDEMAKIHFDLQAAPGYFETLGIPVVEGRPFTRADLEQRRGVMLVSESFARHYWPQGSAVGKRLQPRDGEPDPDNWYTIVGVVGDVRLLRPEQPPPEVIYRPLLSLPGDRDSFEARNLSFALRSGGDPLDLAGPARDRIQKLDSHLPVTRIQTLEQIVSRSRSRIVFVLTLLGLGGAAALLIGAVGLYGVVSYLVSRRTHEIGIRIAIGAGPGKIVTMVLRRSLATSAIGAAIGLLGALFLSRFVDTVLYGAGGLDLWSFAFGVAVLSAVVLVASYLPARRAARVDPTEALRLE